MPTKDDITQYATAVRGQIALVADAINAEKVSNMVKGITNKWANPQTWDIEKNKKSPMELSGDFMSDILKLNSVGENLGMMGVLGTPGKKFSDLTSGANTALNSIFESGAKQITNNANFNTMVEVARQTNPELNKIDETTGKSKLDMIVGNLQNVGLYDWVGDKGAAFSKLFAAQGAQKQMWTQWGEGNDKVGKYYHYEHERNANLFQHPKPEFYVTDESGQITGFTSNFDPRNKDNYVIDNQKLPSTILNNDPAEIARLNNKTSQNSSSINSANFNANEPGRMLPYQITQPNGGVYSKWLTPDEVRSHQNAGNNVILDPGYTKRDVNQDSQGK